MLATPSDPCESHAAFVVTALRHRLRVQLTGDGAETAAAEFSTAWRHLLSSDDRDSDRELTIHVPDDEPGSIATAQARASALITLALIESHIRVVFVTHLFELAHGLYVRRRDDALFLRAPRDTEGRRSFQLIEGEPLPTSFGRVVLPIEYTSGAGVAD